MPKVSVRVHVTLVYEQTVPEGRMVEAAVRNARDLEDWFASLRQTTVPGDGPATLELGLVGHLEVNYEGSSTVYTVSFDPDTETINRIRH